MIHSVHIDLYFSFRELNIVTIRIINGKDLFVKFIELVEWQ